ncbi:hypothetical protein HET73_02735 [Wolbachia endosymbiont of Atemnus politus]|uniref:hypothetical protein n=1 Tax=Wolbachia endosymbiont of Atemnus politus TaxID=2682840 RepID=UPI001571EDFE|nr:hypothetical protein [Wolbachia endosymbiont of Atemnus politus]NSM56479.1 hypothetical protein [Wolbachia endosymbiont of Atemnus politus]NSX83320.1 hypothetical protein [Wolbachia endosymbiont of Atemnus politus]
MTCEKSSEIEIHFNFLKFAPNLMRMISAFSNYSNFNAAYFPGYKLKGGKFL